MMKNSLTGKSKAQLSDELDAKIAMAVDDLQDDLAVETFAPLEALTPTGEAERTKRHLTEEALRITSGARRAQYGPPEMNFDRIARFWQAYFQNTGRNIDVTAADVSPMMRLMKEARLCETPDHLDSYVDLVGYTLTGSEVNGVKVGN